MTDGATAAYYDAARQFLMIEGVIARDVASIPVAPRPKRRSLAAAFDGLGGNTTLGIHLSVMPPGARRTAIATSTRRSRPTPRPTATSPGSPAGPSCCRS